MYVYVFKTGVFLHFVSKAIVLPVWSIITHSYWSWLISTPALCLPRATKKNMKTKDERGSDWGRRGGEPKCRGLRICWKMRGEREKTWSEKKRRWDKSMKGLRRSESERVVSVSSCVAVTTKKYLLFGVLSIILDEQNGTKSSITIFLSLLKEWVYCTALFCTPGTVSTCVRGRWQSQTTKQRLSVWKQ